MNKAILIRTYKPKQTEGLIRLYDSANEYKGKLFSVEKPWLKNVRGISCIPEGEYICTLYPANKTFKYPFYRVANVSGRDGVCIHIANYERELRGCIAPGMSFTDIDGDGNMDAKSSGKALDYLIKTMGKQFKLVICHSV